MKAIIYWYIEKGSTLNGDMSYYDKCVLSIPEKEIIIEYDNWEDNPRHPQSFIEGFNAGSGVELEVEEIEVTHS